MDDQLVIDSSGAWVRKTAELIAEKPLLPLKHLGDLPYAEKFLSVDINYTSKDHNTVIPD